MILHAEARSGRHPQLPCIIWLHGFLGCGDEWVALSETFSDWPQLLVDLPGHGGSAQIVAEDFSAVDRLLRATIMRYNILSYWLVGYSLGGRVAMFHACQRGNSGMRGLVVEGSHPGLADKHQREARQRQDRQWATRFAKEPLGSVLEAWYRQPLFQTLSENQRQQLVALRSRNRPEALARTLEATSLSRQPDLREALVRLETPFYYLCGERDLKFHQLATSLGITPNLIAGAGHNAHREAPAAFSHLLLTLLRHHDFKEPG